MSPLKSNGCFVNDQHIILPRKKREKHPVRGVVVIGILVMLLFSSPLVGFGSNHTGLSFKSLASSPWPMFHHDLNHTGLSPYDTSSNDGTLKWKFKTGDYVGSSPVIGSDGTIYVGSWDDYLYAIGPQNVPEFSSPPILPLLLVIIPLIAAVWREHKHST